MKVFTRSPAETEFRYSPAINNVKESPCLVKFRKPSSKTRPKFNGKEKLPCPRINCTRFENKLKVLNHLITTSLDNKKNNTSEETIPGDDVAKAKIKSPRKLSKRKSIILKRHKQNVSQVGFHPSTDGYGIIDQGTVIRMGEIGSQVSGRNTSALHLELSGLSENEEFSPRSPKAEPQT